MTTWWHNLNEFAADSDPRHALSDAAVALLDDVEAAFAVIGADLPAWPNPRADGPVADEAYGRLTDAIVSAREAAWEQVLLDRGWARLKVDGTRRTLVPHRPGAIPLVLDLRGNGGATFLRIAVGRPAVEIMEHPDCACDGCDFGSDDLLEAIDQDIFSVVDGSLEILVGPDGESMRTSFRGSGRAPDHPGRRILAGPWAAEWSPRELIRQL